MSKLPTHADEYDPPRRRRPASLAVRLTVAGVATMFAFLLAELAVAVIKPQMTWRRLLDGRAKHFSLLSVFEPCDYLPFRLKAGAEGTIESPDFSHRWKVNSHGMREPERSLDKAPGEFRVLALGDSFTAGHGVDEPDCWPRILETLANQQSNEPVRVVNAGYAAGHAPDCYYAYLSRNIDRLKPDAVVIAAFAGNDSFECSDHFWAQVDEHRLPLTVLSLTRYVDETGKRRMTKAARPLSYQYPFLRNSHLWVLLAHSLTPPIAPQQGLHSPHQPDYGPAMEAAYRRSVDCFNGIQRICAEREMECLLAVIPAAHQLSTDARAGVHWEDDFGPCLPQSRWEADLSASGLTYVDLKPPLIEGMEQAGDVWAIYHPTDRHFTAEGQRIAAAAIYKALFP